VFDPGKHYLQETEEGVRDLHTTLPGEGFMDYREERKSDRCVTEKTSDSALERRLWLSGQTFVVGYSRPRKLGEKWSWSICRSITTQTLVRGIDNQPLHEERVPECHKLARLEWHAQVDKAKMTTGSYCSFAL